MLSVDEARAEIKRLERTVIALDREIVALKIERDRLNDERVARQTWLRTGEE